MPRAVGATDGVNKMCQIKTLLSSKFFLPSLTAKSNHKFGRKSFKMLYDEGRQRRELKMGRVLLGIFLGLVFVPVALLGWLWRGHVPVAVADPPLPYEQQLAGMSLHTRIDRELEKISPIQSDEGNLTAGARVYSEKCVVCHGLHGKPSVFGSHMFPSAPPLWEKHDDNDIVGVSDDMPGATYWKVANGIRLTGMPSYKGVLTENEIWQVSLLLANADKPLPPAVVEILRGKLPAPASNLYQKHSENRSASKSLEKPE
jgi:mono/diheme cytochrome c family protein